LVACFDFKFVNNSVTGLNLFKRDPETFFDKHVNWQMQKFGLMIHLTNFKGGVTISDNQVNDVMLNFNDTCLYYENESTIDGRTFNMMPMTPWLAIDDFYTPNMDKETQLLIP